MSWSLEDEQPQAGDTFECPGCGKRLVWEDAVIFGCSCGWEFYEDEINETEFEPEGL